MKVKILIVTSLILITLFAFNACSILDDSGDKSADQLIDESNGIANTSNQPHMITPWESRKLQNNKTRPDFAMPSKLSASGKSPKESRSLAEVGAAAPEQALDINNSAQIQAAQTSTTSKAKLAGSWSFELRDRTLKELAVTLFQNEGVVFGTGSMREGNNTMLAAVSGSIEGGDKLNMDLTTLGTINLYKLMLTTNEDSASGDYKAFSSSGESWAGSAKGTRNTSPE